MIKQDGLQKVLIKKMTMVMKKMVGNRPKPSAHARHGSETPLRISMFHPHNNSRKHFADEETEAQRG